MTLHTPAEQVTIEPAALADGPIPAAPPRPARPLSLLQLMRVMPANSLAVCDEEMFSELFVERRALGRRLFVVSDPEGIRRVMQDNCDNYPRISPIRRLFEFASGTGMVSAEGEMWRRHRRLLNPTLDHRAVIADLPALAALSEQLAEYLGQIPPGQPLNVGETFSHLITAMTGRVFAAEEREIDPILYRMGQYPGKYGFFDFVAVPSWLRSWEARRKRRAPTTQYHELIDRLIAVRRRPDYAGGKDLLWRVAHARDRQTGEGFGTDELRDEVLTLAATSATSLRIFPWFWYLLALHPGAEQRLHQELEAQLAGRAPAADELSRLPYLRRLLDEALRLYPPAPTMLRSVAENDVVCGHTIPRGSVVAVMPWIVHRHKKLWDEPDRFDPERFTPERIAARSRYAYLPFSIGPHVCIGASLALIEILVAVAVIAQRFRFRLVPGRKIEPMAWTNLHPKGGIWMTVEPRNQAAMRG